jgi:ABC-type multidrug transport system fused ATPase/permease subunit
LVSKRTLIILDEATANIDIKTEESIQKAVEEEFENSTMLIIAHRIQTVLHCDRIIVLRDGKIEEMGVVKEMIRKEGSYLKEIYDKLIKK